MHKLTQKVSFSDEHDIDARLFKLSGRFTSKFDLCDVAVRGLGIPGDTVERHIKRNPDDITSAPYDVFRGWVQTQQDHEVASTKINQALESTGRRIFKHSFN